MGPLKGLTRMEEGVQHHLRISSMILEGRRKEMIHETKTQEARPEYRSE
jgi:hypothetical protein